MGFKAIQLNYTQVPRIFSLKFMHLANVRHSVLSTNFWKHQLSFFK